MKKIVDERNQNSKAGFATSPYATSLLFMVVVFFVPYTGVSVELEQISQSEETHTLQEGPVGAALVDGKYRNSLPMMEDDWGVTDLLSGAKEFFGGKEVREPKDPLDITPVPATAFGSRPDTDVSVRWLGHSTMIIEIEGKRILTDPVWSQRVSPLKRIGPKRFYDPPLALDQLPVLDAVLISHDHYDHLDEATIKELVNRDVRFFVPLGVGQRLSDWGVDSKRITELDWWQSAELDGMKLVCTPSRHFSGRGLFDRNKTLWSSWAILGQQRRVFFSGDSGLFPGFSEIGDRYGPFDITMMESGAYNQRWGDVHMGPEQAVIAHRALRGKLMVPIHWGLFNLSLHSWTEPAERLRVIAERDGDRIAFPRPGGIVRPDQYPQASWWPSLHWFTAEEKPVRSSHLAPAWLEKYATSQ